MLVHDNLFHIDLTDCLPMLDAQRTFLKKTLIDPIATNTTLMVLLLGALCIFVAKAYSVSLFSVDLTETIVKLGWSLLGAGVFAVIMKSGQFTELFQKHIADVMYDPANATNAAILPEKWRLFSLARIKQLLPESYAKAAVDGIEKRFFDDELDYHFEKLDIAYKITVDDQDRAKIVNTMTTNLQIRRNLANPMFRQTVRADASVTLTNVFINGVKVNLADTSLFKMTCNPDEHQLVLKLKDYAPGAESITLERTFETVQNLKTEPFITAVMTRFSKGATIRANITDEHTVRFVPMGFNAPGKPVLDGNEFHTWVIAKPGDLLLPGHGYIIIIVPVQIDTGS